MAEMAAPAALAAEQKGGKGKLLAIVALVVVLAGGAAAYVFMGSSGGEAAAEAPAEPVAPVEGAVIDVTTMTVNLGGGAQQYARVGFAVVLNETAEASVVEGRFALLKDAALTRISTYTAEQLLSPVGMSSLRDDLTAAAQEVWPEGEVLRVALTELIVQ